MKIKSRKERERLWPFPEEVYDEVGDEEPPVSSDPVEDWFEEVLRRTTEGVPDQNWIETSDY